MKILLTGGGTLGSVTPLLAIVETWRARDASVKFVWIGTQNGPERELVQETYHIPFCSIPVARFTRYISVELLFLPFRFLRALFISLRIIKTEGPFAVIGAGGFTQVPVMFAAQFFRVKCFAIQTDARPLLASKFTLPFVKKFFVAWKQTLDYFPKTKATVLGVPVRKSILNGSKEKAIARFHLDAKKSTVFVFGGGTGAQRLNELIYEIAPQLCREYNVLHLTGIGKRGELAPINDYIVVEALREEMADAYAVSDLVIARAGMGTIAELCALQKPAILIPIPGSAQEENAKLLSNAALVLHQDENSSEILLDEIRKLMSDKDLLRQFSNRMKNMLRTDVSDDIIDLILTTNSMSSHKRIEWILRVAVAGEFLGHGALAVQGKPAWIEWFSVFGVSDVSLATQLLLLVGIIDIMLAILILLRPVRIALLWMTIWGFWTALLRPIVGEPIWDFIERFANWGAPLALLLLVGWPKNAKEWLK